LILRVFVLGWHFNYYVSIGWLKQLKVRVKYFWLAVFLMVGIAPFSSPIMAQQRGVTAITDASGRNVGFYQDSYALLIGVSDYTAGWPDLESIPNELKAVEAVLKTQGFHVVALLNPNRSALEKAFQDFINQYGFEPQNRLLFFYSGHGETRLGGSKGYLVPSDAPDPAKDEKGFLRKALPMSQIMAWARLIEAKHVLFLFDSCFSGTVFQQKSLPAIPPHISMLTAEPVRQFITAGSAGEAVPAKSVFTPAFIDGLKYGLADLDKDGYVTGTELGVYLQGKVPLHTRQTPQFGKISDYELSRGDFVFTLNPSEPQRIEAPSSTEALQPTRAAAIDPGGRVLAIWKENGCFFSGEVLEIKDDNYHIHYDFSGDAWVRKDQVFLYQPPSLSDLQPNTPVFIGLDSGGKWAPGRIQENRNGQFLVRLDDKNRCGSEKPFNWATLDMLILRR
jgi:hypothetical protein